MSKHSDARTSRARTFIPAQVRKIGKRGWLFVGGTGVVIALITGILQISDELSERPSAVDRVELHATSLGVSSGYALPIDAPFDEMPMTFAANPSGVGYVCAPELLDWLETYGRQHHAQFQISMRSTADSGARITLRDFTTKGKLTTPPIPLVNVICASPIGAAISSQQAALRTGTGSTAVFTDLGELAGAFNQPEGGSPVLYELEPGEPATVAMTLSGDQNFEGSLTAAVLSGDEVREVIIPVEGARQVFVPSFHTTEGLEIRIVPPLASGDTGSIQCSFLMPTGQEDTWECTGDFLVRLFEKFVVPHRR